MYRQTEGQASLPYTVAFQRKNREKSTKVLKGISIDH